MTDKEIKITSLNLVIGKKELQLTVEESKKLYAALKEMFDKEVIKEVYHYPYWTWNYPKYTWFSGAIDPNIQLCSSTTAKINIEDGVTSTTNDANVLNLTVL